MSNENPTPAPEPQPSATPPIPPAQPPQPYQQQGQQPVQVQYQYVPRSQRPPLTKRAKTGAAWAGIIGFNMLTIGFFLFAVPLALLAVGSLFGFLVSEAIRQDADFSMEGLRFLETIDPALWLVPLLIASAVGLVIWVLGLIVSRGILRSSGAVRPWAITWAATGIAVIAYWIIWTIIGAISSIISSFIGILTQSLGNQATAGLIGSIISLLFAVIINSIIGWLCWLWMAHAMRPTHEQLAAEGIRK